MTERIYTNPRTGEVVDNPPIRAFSEVLGELAEGATDREAGEMFYDLLQRVQDTGKAGSITLSIAVGFDGQARISIKDNVSVKLPEFNRPTTAFFIDNTGNASRRDPNQPNLPGITDITQKAGTR